MTNTERTDLVDSLRRQRDFLRFTVQDLTDEQARKHTTASALTLGGLIKHVAITERMWADFIVNGPAESTVDYATVDWSNPPAELLAWQDGHRMTDTETLAGLLEIFDEVAAQTDELVTTLPDLDAAQPLPEAPWFEAGATWSARRVVLHVIAEIAQHSGHADIIRESLDGQKTMG